MTSKYTDIVFDGPPAPKSGRFVEVEDHEGRSVSVGEWIHRGGGYWVLRLPIAAERLKELQAAKQKSGESPTVNDLRSDEGLGRISDGDVSVDPAFVKKDKPSGG